MKKNDWIVVALSALGGGIISALSILAVSAKIGFGSIADWAGTLATTAAVIVALLPQLKKPRPVVRFQKVDHRGQGSIGLMYSSLAYTNVSAVAGFFEMTNCRWRKSGGTWTDFHAIYFDQAFSVVPFQTLTETNKAMRMINPNEYSPYLPKEKDDPFGNRKHELVDWDEAEIIYVDRESKTKLVLQFTSKNHSEVTFKASI